jgi:hypothetical protein
MFDSNDAILKTWAAKRYPLLADDIKSVHFDTDTEWSGGCETCGWDETFVEVRVYFNSGGAKTFNEAYTTELINSILDVAREGSG